MEYRTATATDVLVLAQMNHRLIRDERHSNRMTVVELEQRMAAWLQGEYRAVLFVDARGPSGSAQNPAGYALFKEEPDWINLRQFFVEPARRRQGIGRAAIQWLLANPWKSRARVRLDVLVGNQPAIEFWHSVGFADYCLTMERQETCI